MAARFFRVPRVLAGFIAALGLATAVDATTLSAEAKPAGNGKFTTTVKQNLVVVDEKERQVKLPEGSNLSWAFKQLRAQFGVQETVEEYLDRKNISLGRAKRMWAGSLIDLKPDDMDRVMGSPSLEKPAAAVAPPPVAPQPTPVAPPQVTVTLPDEGQKAVIVSVTPPPQPVPPVAAGLSQSVEAVLGEDDLEARELRIIEADLENARAEEKEAKQEEERTRNAYMFAGKAGGTDSIETAENAWNKAKAVWLVARSHTRGQERAFENYRLARELGRLDDAIKEQAKKNEEGDLALLRLFKEKNAKRENLDKTAEEISNLEKDRQEAKQRLALLSQPGVPPRSSKGGTGSAAGERIDRKKYPDDKLPEDNGSGQPPATQSLGAGPVQRESVTAGELKGAFTVPAPNPNALIVHKVQSLTYSWDGKQIDQKPLPKTEKGEGSTIKNKFGHTENRAAISLPIFKDERERQEAVKKQRRSIMLKSIYDDPAFEPK